MQIKQFEGDHGPLHTATNKRAYPQGPHWWRRVRGIASKVWSFIKTVTRGRVSRDVAFERFGKCLNCDQLQHHKGHYYCGGCGCGKWVLARLLGFTGKLRWKHATCPHPKGAKW